MRDLCDFQALALLGLTDLQTLFLPKKLKKELGPTRRWCLFPPFLSLKKPNNLFLFTLSVNRGKNANTAYHFYFFGLPPTYSSACFCDLSGASATVETVGSNCDLLT